MPYTNNYVKLVQAYTTLACPRNDTNNAWCEYNVLWSLPSAGIPARWLIDYAAGASHRGRKAERGGCKEKTDIPGAAGNSRMRAFSFRQSNGELMATTDTKTFRVWRVETAPTATNTTAAKHTQWWFMRSQAQAQVCDTGVYIWR